MFHGITRLHPLSGKPHSHMFLNLRVRLQVIMQKAELML
jgi:hypothetical protein